MPLNTNQPASFEPMSRSLALQSTELWRRPEALVLGGGAAEPICVHLEGLSAGQRRMCQLYPDHMASVARGVRSGIAECQYQLHSRRWNCSTTNDSSVFGPILSAGKFLHRHTATTTATTTTTTTTTVR